MLRIMLVLGLAVGGCATEPKRTVAEPEWYGRMHKLSVAHLDLTPLTASAKSFKDPRNQAALEANLKRMADLASDIAGDPKAPNADPMIEHSAANFAQYSRQAYTSYKAGDYSWTKFALRKASDQCISCHTRADRGAKDFALAWKPELFSLNRPQRIEFWLANRQYSMAISEALHLAGDEKEVLRDPGEWLATLQKVMVMVVRVERSPRAAEILTNNALGNAQVPFFIRADLNEWKRDIQTWKTQRRESTERGRFKVAQGLILRENFVANLRASMILHELLENSKFPLYPDALEASGTASANLKDHALGQYYYEACIRELPHSVIAERCFAKLYRSLRETNPFLESGYAEHDVIQTKLAQLRELAGTDRVLEKSRSRADKSDDVP